MRRSPAPLPPCSQLERFVLKAVNRVVGRFVNFTARVVHRADVFAEATRNMRAVGPPGLGAVPRDGPLPPAQQLRQRPGRRGKP